MPDSSNRYRSERFREATCWFLRGMGLPVKPRPGYRKLSEALADDAQASDIQGLTQWAITTRHEYKADFSGALDHAVKTAERDGKKWGAAVQWRQGDRSAGETYVVIELGTFAEVLRALEGLD